MNRRHTILTSGVAYPPPPSREQVLGVQMHFMGGILVPSAQYGLMPWWDTALSWCDAQTRRNAYAQKHAWGDTHILIEIPNGKPLYDEYGQFYSPDKFGPLDWTHGMTTLAGSPLSALVDEGIRNGFKFLIAMDEVSDQSRQIVQMVMRELTSQQLRYGVTMPGYDGVFYGWSTPDIIDWAARARAIRPDAYLGIEFNPGHIPVGNGEADYKSGGAMSGYDMLLGEFPDFTPGNGSAGATVWQVVGRCVYPYIWPNDEPWDADSHPPPFYLTGSTRGYRTFCAFETDYPYKWVRINPTDAAAVARARSEMDGMRRYFRNLGCTYTG